MQQRIAHREDLDARRCGCTGGGCDEVMIGCAQCGSASSLAVSYSRTLGSLVIGCADCCIPLEHVQVARRTEAPLREGEYVC